MTAQSKEEIIKRAQELVQEFDGQITEEWKKSFAAAYYKDEQLIMHRFATYEDNILDIKAICSVPEMLALIKRLLIIVDVQAANAKWVDETIIAGIIKQREELTKENQDLKQRIAELENKDD